MPELRAARPQGSADIASAWEFIRAVGDRWESGAGCWPDGGEEGGPSFCHWRMSWTLRWWAVGQCHMERYWAKYRLPPGCCLVSAQEVGPLGNCDLLLLSDDLGMYNKKKHCLLMCFPWQI